MEFFPDQALVRLRSRVHGTYLHAENDGVGVSMNPHRAYLHTAWWVHRVRRDGRDYILLHSAAYGRYLAVSRVTMWVDTRHHANLTVHGVYETPEQDDVLWEADTVAKVIVIVLHASHRLLSVSPSNTSAFRHALVVDSAYRVCCGSAAFWEVETIPVRPEPPVIHRLTDVSSPSFALI